MGISMVGAKLTKRIARETQQDVVRAWGHGGYEFDFVTDHHEHGWWNKKTGEWGWTPEDDVVHPNSCHEKPWSDVFTGEPVPIAERDQPPQTIRGVHPSVTILDEVNLLSVGFTDRPIHPEWRVTHIDGIPVSSTYAKAIGVSGDARVCRVCGCTDEQACLPPGGPCYWVELDLCSACRPEVP